MSNYRKAKIDGGVFFFTVVLADRRSHRLVTHIDRFTIVLPEDWGGHVKDLSGAYGE